MPDKPPTPSLATTFNPKMTGPNQTSSRPSFSSSVTSDRLRESARIPKSPVTTSCKPSGARKSVFTEIGLEDDRIANKTGLSITSQRSNDTSDRLGSNEVKKKEAKKEQERKSWISRMSKTPRPMVKTSSSAPPGTFPTLPRIALIAVLLAVVVPGITSRGKGRAPMDGADAGVIRTSEMVKNGKELGGRANSPTDICTRWAHQSALVNGTLYIYGGETKTSDTQTENTWNDNFITLDLTKSWDISSPPLTGLPQPSGPPAVAEGFLWSTYTSLFLYGGEFADNPFVAPLSVSTWEYSIAQSTWIEHAAPVTTAGNNSDPGNVAVQRAAEGSGLSVPELGVSYYFGGHQDLSTTEGWSNQIERVYLKSLLEFTHPGYQNTGVQGLGIGQSGAPAAGAYRNITQGGLQADAGFTERADGVLVYVPGWGASGILLGLAGGTNATFTQMNEIDVYDIASSTWYKQSTSGAYPSIRVSSCAVVFAAPDASSFQVHLYGGQNLQPAGAQTQYGDMWILSIPSFTWISVDTSSQSAPAPRAGHTCHASNGQMVVVGGYVGDQIGCDSPGIFVFNATSLSWQNNYSPNVKDEQVSGDQETGYPGSYGYLVPGLVQSAIGGGPSGTATATTPSAGAATAGPIATGRPPTYTVTQGGTTVMQTSTAIPTPAQPSTSTSSKESPNVGAIAAGAVAGVLFCLAAYLAFCTWLYRRQLAAYKNHVAMSQRASLGYSSSPENILATRTDGVLLKEKPVGTGPERAALGVFGTSISHSNSNVSSQGSSAIAPIARGPLPSRKDSFHGQQDDFVGYGRGRTDSGRLVGTGGRYASVSEERDPEGEHRGTTSNGTGNGEWDRGSDTSSTDDLLAGQEPSFFSVVMSPRRTLKVINRD